MFGGVSGKVSRVTCHVSRHRTISGGQEGRRRDSDDWRRGSGRRIRADSFRLFFTFWKEATRDRFATIVHREVVARLPLELARFVSRCVTCRRLLCFVREALDVGLGPAGHGGPAMATGDEGCTRLPDRCGQQEICTRPPAFAVCLPLARTLCGAC